MNFPGPINSSHLSSASAVSLDSEHFNFTAHSHVGSNQGPADGIIVPDKHLLFEGHYARDGNDLVLSAQDQKYVVHDYFKGDKRPALLSEDGAMLSGHIVSSLTGYVQYAQATPAADAAQVIGHVMKLTGSASVIRNGVTVELNVGDAVQKGDVIQTGSESSVALTLIDGTAFGMTANARMVLSEMVYDPNGSSNSSFVSLVQGTITFVAGQTAKNGNMRVETPVATMGIRGTAVLVKIDAVIGDVAVSLGVEPDGHVGGLVFYDNNTGALVGTMSQAGRVTIFSPSGVGQPITAAEYLKSPDQVLSDKSLFNQVFQLYFPNFNPDANPKSTDQHGSTITPPPTLTGLTGTDPTTGRPTITYTIQVINPDTHVTTDVKITYVNTPPIFIVTNATDIQATVLGPHQFKLGDHVKIIDPDVGAAPFFDVAVPYVTNSGGLTKATTTSPAPTSYLLNSNLVSLDPVTGVVTYNPEGFRFLGAGEKAVYTFQFISASGVGGSASDRGTETLTLTITGENDSPVFAATNTPVAITETPQDTNDSTPNLATIQLAFTDEDFSDTAGVFHVQKTVSTNLTGAHQTADLSKLPSNAVLLTYLTFDNSVGTSSGVSRVPLTDQGTVTAKFSAPDNVFDFLAEGEQVQIVYTITLDDGHAGSTPTTETITFTITGTNDQPVLAADTGSHGLIETTDATLVSGVSTLAVNGSLAFSDVDLTDRHSTTSPTAITSAVWEKVDHTSAGTIPTATLTALATALTTSLASDTTNGTGGQLNWNFKLADSYADFLAKGETLTIQYTVAVSDGHTDVGTATQPITIVITGTNDAPVINTIAETDLNEQTDTNPLTTTIPVTFIDVDLDNVGHTAAITGVTVTGVKSGLTLDTAGLEALITPETVLKASGSSSGSVNLDFSAASTVFDYLAAGEKVTLTYTVAIDDHAGGATSQNFTVVVTGTNDAPVINTIGSTVSDNFNGTSIDTAKWNVYSPIVNHPGAIVDPSVSESGGVALLHDRGTLQTTVGFTPAAATPLHIAGDFKIDDTFGQLLVADRTDGSTETEFGSPANGIQFLVWQPGIVKILDSATGNTLASIGNAGLVVGENYHFDITDDGANLTFTITDSSHNVVASLSAVDSSAPAGNLVTFAGREGDDGTHTLELSNVSITGIAETDLNEQADTNPLTTTIPVTFTDVDLNNVGHTAAITGVSVTGVTTGLTLDTASLEALITPETVLKASGSSSGSVNLDFSAASTVFDYLAAGEKVTLTYTVAIDDHAGGVTSQNFAVVVTGTNDAPVLAVATPQLTTITADATTNGGQTVASFLTGVSDVDDGAVQGIAVTATNDGNGYWEYSLNGTDWSQLHVNGTGTALLLTSSDHVRFVPDGTDATTASLTYHAWDQTQGTNGGAWDLSGGSGGSTAFSVGTQTAMILVTGLNAAPVVSISGDTAPTFTTYDYAGANATYAFGINDAGQIVGAADLPSGHQTGWEYSDGAFSAIYISGDTTATAIDNSGVVAGYYSPHPSTPRYGFTETSGSFSGPIDLLPNISTTIIGSNDAGVVVGASYLHDGTVYKAYIDDHGSVTYFSVPGTETSTGYTDANDINNVGQIVGSFTATYGSNWQSYLYQGGQFTTISDPDAVQGTFAHGINDEGQIVGWYVDANGISHGFIDNNGAFITIDAPLGVNGTALQSINNDGQVAGFYIDSSNVQHGFVASLNATAEDTPLTLHGVSVSDADAGSSPIQVSLSVAHGSLSLADTTGLTTDGLGTGTVLLTGSQADIDATLGHGLTYVPGLHYSGADTLNVTATDNLGSHSATEQISLTVNPVNDAPVLNADNVSPLEIGGSNGHPAGTTLVTGVTLTDANYHGDLSISATAQYGTVTDSNGDALPSSGTFANIDSILTNGVIYTPTAASPDDIDKVTLTVGHGQSDTLTFVFHQQGTGSATLTGTPGNDIIFASGYGDTLTGLGGHDNFVFAPHSGAASTVTDFTSGEDKIVLNGFDATAIPSNSTDLATWLAAHASGAVNAVIDLNNATDPGPHETITLTGVAAANLNANDFIIHPGSSSV